MSFTRMTGSVLIAVLPTLALTQSQSVNVPNWRTELNCGAFALPRVIDAALKRFADLLVSCRLKPKMIRGDFDGDGREDYALLVIERQKQQRGFLIAFASGQAVVAGAGRLVMYGAARTADLNFDEWELHRRQDPVESGEDQMSLTLQADALLVSHHESASGLFYWRARSIHWYQQGD